MDDEILSLTFVATGALLIALAIPLIRRKVRPNRLYGFRVPATLNDERVWYEVNAVTGLDLLVVGAGVLLLSLLHALGLFSTTVFALASGTWMTLGVLWAVPTSHPIRQCLQGCAPARPRVQRLFRSASIRHSMVAAWV